MVVYSLQALLMVTLPKLHFPTVAGFTFDHLSVCPDVCANCLHWILAKLVSLILQTLFEALLYLKWSHLIIILPGLNDLFEF